VNEARRKAIAEAISKIEEAKDLLDTASTEERDEYEELSEKAQESDKGTAIEAAASTLEESLDECDSLINKLNDAKV
jgi:hypothetical protein